MLRLRPHAARAAASLALIASAAACKDQEHVRADSAMAASVAQQQVLAKQLASQKDSLMNVVLDADHFISQIDSEVSRVKGLPKRQRDSLVAEGPLQQQIAARRDMLFKVDALVKRAQATARQLAEAKKREAALKGENKSLRETIDGDEKMIAQLNETIQRQTASITGLTSQVDSLTGENHRLSEELTVTQASFARTYYIVGREADLLKKGVVVKEGGVPLIFGRVGKSLQPARSLDPSLFKAIDTREVKDIAMPDPRSRYKLVSRQSLDAAEVAERDKQTWKGNLHIADPGRFWGATRYLIIVQQ